jgi:hypothetical protein
MFYGTIPSIIIWIPVPHDEPSMGIPRLLLVLALNVDRCSQRGKESKHHLSVAPIRCRM